MLAAVLLIALAVDLRPGAAPGPRRQVNERWLDEYRGWVYGAGFGAQLGIGVTTVVTSAATYAALLAALLAGSAAGGGPDPRGLRRASGSDAAAGRPRPHARAAPRAARGTAPGASVRPARAGYALLAAAGVLALIGALA